MKFVGIEPGEFMMGSPSSDLDGRADEKPQHLVRITRRFCLGMYEVTQGQFQKVMSANPSKHKGSELPVYHLSWLDAVQFCNRLSELEARNSCYRIVGEEVTIADGNGYRLPTEAEWEYACRAGSATAYCFGDDDSQLGEFAWFGGNSGNAPHPVGQKRPNAFGLHDMHGNVWEWCWDAYAGNYYYQSPAADPSGPAKSSPRVFRGGNWGIGREPRPHRSAKRGWNGPQILYGGVGIRLALNEPRRA
jgi:formylglycine-generating enzyme required for sulfatase activity